MTSEHAPKVLIVDDLSANLDALEATLAASDCLLVRAPHAPPAPAGSACVFVPLQD